MARQFLCSSDAPIVQTKAGKIRGFVLDGTNTFYGIKYANAKRWHMPEPVEPWEGVKDATSYGYIAPLMSPASPMGDITIPHRFWPEDEHCQYLNVWSRDLNPDAKKPVMFWIHGGGFAAGSSIEMVAYDGDRLATWGDVVVVSINHRLNMLGYLDLSDFGEEYYNSANAGQADIVAALEWVRDNIANFGGDPDNVTIFGQSGGGMKVTSLLQTPCADGLFHRAIVMSGVAGGFGFGQNRRDKEIVEAVMEQLNIQTVAELEKVKVPKLFEAFHAVEKKLRKQGIVASWGPKANDWYVGDPLQVGFTAHAKTVPTMVGTVMAEFAFGPSTPHKDQLTESERRALVADKFGEEHADELIELFKAAYPGKNIADVRDIDTMFRPSTAAYLDLRGQATESPCYGYMFALNFSYDDGKPAWHCSDIPFAFHNTEIVPVANMEGVSDKLEAEYAGAYVAFARTGDPNHEGMAHWPVYTPEKKTMMVFDRETAARDDLDTELVKKVAEYTPLFDFSAFMMEDDE